MATIQVKLTNPESVAKQQTDWKKSFLQERTHKIGHMANHKQKMKRGGELGIQKQVWSHY
jgi:hypothetical protein